MPRIHSVTVHRRTVPLVRPFVTAVRVAREVEAVLVEVRDGRTLKVKTGAGGDDVAMLAAVREAVGPDVTLRADANQGWTPRQAVSIIRAWEDAGVDVELVEQPVHRDDLDGLAFVTARVVTPVLADEAVWTRRDLRQVIERRAAGLVNIKLAKTGGLREALALARMAEEYGVGVLVGCMSESHVGIASAAALASALAPADGATVPQDLDAGLWLTAGPVDGGIAYEGESIMLADAPGTGIRGLAR